MELEKWKSMTCCQQIFYLSKSIGGDRMENRKLPARIQCRMSEKEREIFYEICKHNKLTAQDILRNYILHYIEVNKDNVK